MVHLNPLSDQAVTAAEAGVREGRKPRIQHGDMIRQFAIPAHLQFALQGTLVGQGQINTGCDPQTGAQRVKVCGIQLQSIHVTTGFGQTRTR